MKDADKTKKQLISELVELRERVTRLEAAQSARAQAEHELHESQEHLDLALERSSEGFWDWDIPTGNIRFSPRWAELLEYKVEELEPSFRAWEKLILPDDKPEVMRALNQHLEGSIPYCEVEHRLITKTGELRWFLAHGQVVKRDEQGGALRMVGTHVDITERKWVEEALQNRNCELALLNHAVQAFNSTLDLDRVLVTVLGGVRYLLDVTACSIWLVDSETGELVCRQASGPLSEMVCGWRLAPGQGFAGWVVRHGQPLVVSDIRHDERHFKEVDHKTGVEYRSILSLPLWAKQQVIGALHILDISVNRFDAIDLTLLESLAATASTAIENARLYEQARQAAESKSMLLNEVNHRVKNNLAAIIGLLYAEKRHGHVPDEAGYQTSMQKLISRVQGLATAHRLLSSSDWEPLSLIELATQIVNSALQVLPLDKQVVVDVKGDPVLVLPEQASSLALVLNELATNAIKYALQERESARITVRISSQAGTVQLEFRDDGPGYPEPVIRFEQYNVGLYLIRSIVRGDLRGKLTLRNEGGAVTTIHFEAAFSGQN